MPGHAVSWGFPRLVRCRFGAGAGAGLRLHGGTEAEAWQPGRFGAHAWRVRRQGACAWRGRGWRGLCSGALEGEKRLWGFQLTSRR